MAMARITRALTAAPPSIPAGARKIRIYDTEITGFVLEIHASGSMFFFLRYTDPRGRTREVKLGRPGEVTAEQARVRARVLRAQIVLGGDPAGERDKMRAALTFADFVTERYLPYILDRRAIGTYADYEAMCRLRLTPALGRKGLDEISSDDVAILRRGLAADGLSPARVNRHLAVLRAALGLAIAWGLRPGPNPAGNPGMAREEPRQRFLTETEARAPDAGVGYRGRSRRRGGDCPVAPDRGAAQRDA